LEYSAAVNNWDYSAAVNIWDEKQYLYQTHWSKNFGGKLGWKIYPEHGGTIFFVRLRKFISKLFKRNF
jgi:hypothetical protein